jgi:DMSO/TMAO reductase YedYZ molybdopterin-dependent catalytic subunit
MEITAAIRISRKSEFLAGAVAGLAMTVLLVALRFSFNTQVITEVMADWLTELLPPSLFDLFLERLQFNAKRLLFVMIFLGQVLAGGFIGIGYARLLPPPAGALRPLWHAVVLAFVLWLVLTLVVTPVMGAGAFGSDLPDGATAYAGSLLVALIAFALALNEMQRLALVRGGGYSEDRRAFMRNAAIFGVVAVVGGFALRTIITNLGNLTPVGTFRQRGTLATEITPNDEFYVIAKSAVVPSVDAATWRLTIGGKDDSPFQVSYDELLAMPSIEQYVTLTCISNPIGGDLIGSALWKGVRLKHLLQQADLAPETERLAFHAADGYYDSFGLDVAMRDEVIVAYEMNGVPLPKAHGFPARIIVPGLYGMEHVKWLSRIEPVAVDFRGFWQRRGWADTAVIKTMSRVDVPADGSRVPKNELWIAGVAFAGKRGIGKIEVSIDGGASWAPAGFTEPLSEYTWVIWEFPWRDAPTGMHDVLVRATDGTGTTQTQKRKSNQPDGPDGYHEISVSVQVPAPDPTVTSRA